MSEVSRELFEMVCAERDVAIDRARLFETMIMRCIDVYDTQDVDQSHAVDELRAAFDALDKAPSLGFYGVGMVDANSAVERRLEQLYERMGPSSTPSVPSPPPPSPAPPHKPDSDPTR